jgi:RNA polymerase sigma factor (TIGR02999 family)
MCLWGVQPAPGKTDETSSRPCATLPETPPDQARCSGLSSSMGHEAHTPSTHAVLQSVASGSQSAMNELFARFDTELRKNASGYLRELGVDEATYRATELTNDAFTRFARSAEQLRARDREAFFAYMGAVMRSVILDNFKHREAQRRAPKGRRVPLDADPVSEIPRTTSLIDLDEALAGLRKHHPEAARSIELVTLQGRTLRDAADLQSISLASLRSNLSFGFATLRKHFADRKQNHS